MKKRMSLQIITILCMLISITTYAANFITDGLVSHWTFDRNTIDEDIVEDVWGENDATIKGNPTLTTGVFRQGLEFDGLGDYVILSNLDNFQTHIGPSTIELWMKTSDTSTYRTLFRVVHEICVVKNRSWGLTVNGIIPINPPPVQLGGPPDPFPNQDQKVVFKEGYVLHENTQLQKGQPCNSNNVTPFRHTISDGEWHHIVLVTNALYTDETGMVYRINNLYIDNLHFPNVLRQYLRLFLKDKSDLNPYTLPVYLGASNTNGRAHGYFRGVIDEVRVYNRALTHDEVTNNYLSQDSLAVKPTGKLPMVWGELKARR